MLTTNIVDNEGSDGYDDNLEAYGDRCLCRVENYIQMVNRSCMNCLTAALQQVEDAFVSKVDATMVEAYCNKKDYKIFNKILCT